MDETGASSQEANKTGSGVNSGCSVDWGWLAGRKVARAYNDLQTLIVEFEDGLTWKIQALNYKGEPFLSFNPYKDPGAA